MRLIDADALNNLEEMEYIYFKSPAAVPFYEADKVWAVIENAPTIEAEPVKHGRWVEDVESKLDTHTGEYWKEVYYNCLECDYASDWNSPYCPNCGAKMDVTDTNVGDKED